jgi:hypothetical protein
MGIFTDRWKFKNIFGMEAERDEDRNLKCMVRRFKYV